MIFVHDTPTNRLLNMVLGAMAGGKTVEATALGNPLTFITDVSKPLKSLLIPFTPQQSGTGNPSPENIRPILPWNGLTVWNGGKNLLKITAQSKTEQGVTWQVEGDTIIASGTATGYTKLDCGELNVVGLKNIVISGLQGTTNIVWECVLFDSDGNRLWTSNAWYGNVSIYIPDYPTAKKLLVSIKRNSNVTTSGIVNIQAEVGQTATAYEPYKPITETDIVFPSHVYGGTLDVVSGVMTVLWKRVLLKGEPSGVSSTYQGSLFYNQNILSDADFEKEFVCNRLKYVGYTTTNFAYGTCINNSRSSFNLWVRETVFADKAEAEAWLADNDTEICYQLKTPVEIQLTPHQLTALIGDNTIWSDADGSMTAVYLKKG